MDSNSKGNRPYLWRRPLTLIYEQSQTLQRISVVFIGSLLDTAYRLPVFNMVEIRRIVVRRTGCSWKVILTIN